jgi:hypothetical protein
MIGFDTGLNEAGVTPLVIEGESRLGLPAPSLSGAGGHSSALSASMLLVPWVPEVRVTSGSTHHNKE